MNPADPPFQPKPQTQFLLKRFFDRSAKAREDIAELRDVERFWDRLADFSVPEEFVEARPRQVWRSYAVLLAPVLLLLVGALWWSLPAPIPPWRSFVSPHGGQTVVMLEDGSKVSLAAESRVDVRFTRRERQLRLVSGQALFNVAHDRGRPFIVQAGEGIVTAVGTAFDIRLGRHDTRVTIVEGIVDIGINGPDAEVAPATIARAGRGEQVDFDLREENGSPVAYVTRRARVDTDSITSWTRGKLFFQGEPLSQAIDIVNSYSSQKLVLRNKSYASMPVYGMLDQGDVRGLIVLVHNKGSIAVEPEG